jgi:hypothetical protein
MVWSKGTGSGVVPSASTTNAPAARTVQRRQTATSVRFGGDHATREPNVDVTVWVESVESLSFVGASVEPPTGSPSHPAASLLQ